MLELLRENKLAYEQAVHTPPSRPLLYAHIITDLAQGYAEESASVLSRGDQARESMEFLRRDPTGEAVIGRWVEEYRAHQIDKIP